MLDLTMKLEKCAEKSLSWAKDSAARFETSKTEALLLTKSKGLWRKKKKRPIQVGGQQISFAKMAARWLGVWPDSALTIVENRRRYVNQARQAKARIQRLVKKHGIPPTSARNFQTAVIQGTLLYASELTWRGGGARGPGGKSMVPVGDKQDGRGNHRHLPIYPARHRDGREQADAGGAAAGFSSGEFHEEIDGLTERVRRPR